MLDHAVTIRAATPHDADTLRRLAALDSRPQPHGNALLAECDGVPIAAIALTSGLVVADPFHPTVDAVHLLGFHSTLSTAYLTMPKTTAPFTVLGSAHNQIFGQTSGTVTVLRKKIGTYQVDLQNQQGGARPRRRSSRPRVPTRRAAPTQA